MKLNIVLTIALAMFIVVGTANAGDTFYTRNNGGNWSTDATWSTGDCDGDAATDYPKTGDTAIICDDLVTVTGTETCGSLTIRQDGQVQTGSNTLTIENSGGLTINAKTTGTNDGLLNVNSSGTVALSAAGIHTINGELRLAVTGATLSVAASPTFSGVGMIRGQDSDAVISIAADQTFTNTLTTGGIMGALKIIDATIDGNFSNQGIVEANYDGGTLSINVSGTTSSAPVTDTGAAKWRCSCGGKLEFGDELDNQASPTGLTLYGDFFLSGADSEIQFDAQPVFGSTPFFAIGGHLEMSAGTLDIDEDVTMGQSGSELLSLTGGTIAVAAGKTFTHN